MRVDRLNPDHYVFKGMKENDMRNRLVLALLVLAGVMFAQAAGAEVDRETVLKEPGVYATFAVFKVGDQWWKMDKDARAGGGAEVKTMLQKHADKVAVDTYLLRGLSENADFFIRVHSKEMRHNPPPQGSPYVVVVPIRKDADWWLMPQDARTALMKEHTDSTTAYLKTVKRKLYHSSGLDDLDFITLEF
jgi:chlorite dismutase